MFEKNTKREKYKILKRSIKSCLTTTNTSLKANHIHTIKSNVHSDYGNYLFWTIIQQSKNQIMENPNVQFKFLLIIHKTMFQAQTDMELLIRKRNEENLIFSMILSESMMTLDENTCNDIYHNIIPLYLKFLITKNNFYSTNFNYTNLTIDVQTLLISVDNIDTDVLFRICTDLLDLFESLINLMQIVLTSVDGLPMNLRKFSQYFFDDSIPESHTQFKLLKEILEFVKQSQLSSAELVNDLETRFNILHKEVESIYDSIRMNKNVIVEIPLITKSFKYSCQTPKPSAQRSLRPTQSMTTYDISQRSYSEVDNNYDGRGGGERGITPAPSAPPLEEEINDQNEYSTNPFFNRSTSMPSVYFEQNQSNWN